MPKTTRRGPIDPRLLRYARSSRGFLVLSVGISLARVVCTIGFAWFLTTAITGFIDNGPSWNAWPTLGMLAGTIAVRAALILAGERSSAASAARMGSELRVALLQAVRRLGPSWLARRNSASLSVIAGHGLEALDAYAGRFLPQLVATVVVTPVLLAVMWLADWPSGLTATLTIPLIPIFMILIGLATRGVQRQQWQTLQHLAARFSDTVAGLGTLRLFGRERRTVTSMERVSERYRTETMKVLRVTFLSGFMLEFLASIAVAIIAVAIGLRLLDGELSLFVGLFVLLLAPEAFLPVREVGVQFHAAAEGVAATEDVFEILDAAAEAPERATSTAPASVSSEARLTVRGLVVHRDPVLPPVSFTATPGTVTVLRGPSGAGKSSVLAALRGAATFDGSATLGTTDIRSLAPSQWLAWAGQRPGLIAGTIAENVALGDPAPRPDAVAWALQTACAEDLEPSALLGVQGAGLSGGQAQRVAVARALYRWHTGAASVIALDEPSSALDMETEAALWQHLRSVADAGATCVLVSHRASAKEIADQIIDILPATAVTG